ncbi:25220_t:CDS:2 [Cetraspora pellucida]|uniref:25220_t:CDS:1 n=1 Tax=Cetraspora pellucida TaxID=1433469 RepID=A0A9N9HTZ2_9GLOM|nr:25220_t:CDS:2 [Cetraspora pellucida]
MASYTRGTASKFWEKVRQLLTVNPESNTGVPVVGVYRTPSPGITAGDQEGSKESTPTAMTIPEKLDLIETIASSPILYSTEKLPPVPPSHLSHRWKKSEDADDPDPGVYWPMKMVS